MKCFLLPASLGLDQKVLTCLLVAQLGWTLLQKSATAVHLSCHLDASSPTFLPAAPPELAFASHSAPSADTQQDPNPPLTLHLLLLEHQEQEAQTMMFLYFSKPL